VRQLEGMRLERVRYYEHPGSYPAWRELAVLDSISYGVDLIGDDRAWCVTWDNRIVDYGLIVHEGILLDLLKDALVTDVTQDSRWSSLVGQRISQVRVHWCPVQDGSPGVDGRYPQDIQLVFEQGHVVLFSAATSELGKRALVEMADNVAVLFGDDVIRVYGLGPYRPAG